MQYEHVVLFNLNSELREKDEEKGRQRIKGEKKNNPSQREDNVDK